ncbi:MAG: hypothetical protein M0R69_04645 [Candidatus Cloacimonetes bacterium]|nr:hypothetical protein [Candidatus Cloacimonadota bacterium]
MYRQMALYARKFGTDIVTETEKKIHEVNMKKYILLATLYLFMAALMARVTGLYDLSYAQDMAEAHEALLAKGFEEIENDYAAVIYRNAKIPELIDLELQDTFDVGSISSWTARFNVKDNPGFVQKMLSDLKAIHKKEPAPSAPNIEDWFWDLGDTYELGMYLSEDKSTLTIEYIDIDESWFWGDSSDW